MRLVIDVRELAGEETGEKVERKETEEGEEGGEERGEEGGIVDELAAFLSERLGLSLIHI